MGGIPIITKKVRMERELAIPEQYSEEFSKELLSVNVKREIVLARTLAIMIVAILTISSLSLYTKEESIYVSLASYRLHILLLFGALSFLMLTAGKRDIIYKNVFALRLTHISINSFVLILCAIIAVNNELAGQRPFSYLTAMLCIGSVILMPTHERLFIYILSWGIYQAGIIFRVRDPMIIFQNFFFVTMLMAVSLLISKINYSAYISNFTNRIIIEQNKEEIDRLYRVTEEILQKRTEELNRAIELEKLRTAFFANISHELRTPLNVIFSTEQMLDRTLKSMRLQVKQKEINQYMRIMKQNCYRLIRLIANLIDMTKIDAGHLQFNPKSCDIIKIVEDITLSVADYIEEKSIRLTFDTDIEEKVILCDPDMIERIVVNLLSNAVKFSTEGGYVYVSICCGSNKIILSVEDNGIGIPPEMVELIFDKFVQVNKTYTRDREGSGIGLSLVKSFVEMHGGSISVESNLGKGSKFIIEIPAIEPDYENSCQEYEYLSISQNIEKVSIEFSDIYDL